MRARILGAIAGLAALVLSGCCGSDTEFKTGKGKFQGYYVECDETKSSNIYSRKVFIKDIEDPNDKDFYYSPTMQGASDSLWNKGREVWTTLLVYDAPDDHPFRAMASFETLDAAYETCMETE